MGEITVEPLGSGAYRLVSELTVAQPLDAVFPFFSDARNLELVTPSWLSFRVVTPDPIVIETGSRIDYRLRIHGVPLRWTSLIEAWEPPYRFSDRQVRGPYGSWLHEHTFREVDGGTLVRDRVDFELPGGRVFAQSIGRLAGRVVASDVRRIFAFRRERMAELFG